VPPVLEPYGKEGAAGPTFAAALVAATEHCEVAYATGSAGDVYLCHPFLVHAAQANHGTRPRSVWRYKVGIRPPSMTKSDPVMLAALSLVR